MFQTQILLSGSTIQFETRKINVQEKIGEGLQAIIYKVIDLNSNEYFVLKHQKQFKSNLEVQLIQKIKGKNYKNIVNVIDYVYHNNELLILMEKCECDLLTYLNKINDDDFRYIASEISQGLKVIHDLQYIHRDVKPENIMISKLRTSNDRIFQPICKLADFGIIQHLSAGQTMFIGTPYYLAPEQLQIDQAKYTQSVDIWALGAVFYEIWTKRILFQGSTVEQVYQNINNLDIIEAISKLTLSKNYQSLILSMLNRDASKRPTIDQVIEKLKPNLRLAKSTNIRQLNHKIQINNKEYIVLDTICSTGTYITYKVQNIQSKMALNLTKYYTYNHEQYQVMSMISQNKNRNWVNIHDLQVKNNELFVIMEQYSRTFQDEIIKGQKIDPKDFRYIALELSKGLQELHKSQLIHTNINPKTTMITKHQDQQTSHSYNIYKIGDFSNVQIYKTEIEYEDYQAPEQRNQRQHSLSCLTDIWQLGALLFELFTLKKLGQVENIGQELKELQISDNYKNLLKSMLNENSSDRPSSKQVCDQLSLNIQNQQIKQVQGMGTQKIEKKTTQTRIISNYSKNQNQGINRQNRFYK